MKIKELQKCVNISWSPGQEKQYQQEIPIMLAAGTAGQQLDASGTSSLEVYAINLDDPSYDMTLKGSQTNPYRFHKIIWSPIGIGGQQYPNGIIVGGCEGGHLQLFNANTIMNGAGGGGGAAEALIAQQDKHTGAVRSLDYNPFQQNLLASGSSESEILIWDLNNVTTPMTPGTKTQPFEDIQNLAWNKQVQHILGSVFSQRCVIWDLRKNEPIIKLTDTQSRVRWHAVQWHPDVATQLWLASEDDLAPIVQLWDLRYATAPTKSIQIHQRGILGLSWCKQDLDLMVSCGKDNRILCWNPNVEQSMIVDEQNGLVSEVASTIQWYSDVIWCPKNPAILASSSLEGMVSVYSVFGGTQQQLQTTNKIADSFPGMETFAQIPVPQNITQITYNDLKQPPKWMKRPIGATFGFGGKLITFQNTNTGISIGGQQQQQQQQPPQQSVTAPQSSYIVSINQIITEPNLIERSIKLEDVLSKGNFIDYCRYRADQMADQHGRYVWYFLKANFEENTRAEMLNLLGYKSEDMQFKFKKITEQKDINQDVIQLTNKMVDLSRSESSEVEDDSTDISADDNSTINGNRTETPPINLDTTKEIAIDDIPFKINVNDQLEGLICQALITGNVESAVDLCMEAKRYADAIIIAMSGGTELLARTQYRYLKQSKGYLSHIISALVTDDWSGVIQQCTVDSWKEALCAALTHCPINEQMFELCEKLGERLQEQLDNQNRKQSGVSALQNAILCYICAGNIEKLVDAWLQLNRGDDHYDNDVLNADGDGDRSHSSRSILVLQDLVEIIILFQKSMELKGKNVQAIGKTANILSRYAQLLATQGALHSALTYLGPSDDSVIVDLRERLYYALGHKIQQRQQQQHQQQHPQQQQSSIYASGNMFSQRNPSLTNQMPSAMLQSQPHQQQQQQQLPGMMYPQQQQQQTTSQLFNTNLPGANIQQKPPQLQPPIVNPWNQNQNILQPSSTTNILQPALSNIGAPPPSVPPPTSNTVMGQQQQQHQHQQPPRPSSVSSQSGGGIGNNTSALPKNKYLLDPSVQSNYGGQIQHSYQSPINNQQQQFNQFQPLQQPQPYFNDNNQQFKPFSPPLMPITSLNNNNNYLSGGPPIEHTQQGHQFNQMLPPNQQQNQQPQQRNPTPPPGWNDPPAVKTSRHPSAAIKQQQLQQQQQDTNNMNAITHPLFGQDPNQMQMNNNNNNGYIYDQNANIQPIEVGQSALPPPPSSSSSLSSMQARSGSSQSINQTYSNNYQPQQQQQFQMPRPPSVVQQQQQQRQQASTPIVKEKLPLPEEYVYMQTVFDELRLQCTHTASNAQTKRKLEDVGKRLENLYDLLRENRLTTTTLTSLNQLVQLVQIGDYVNGLGLHTQMISGPDFSQIANFMPGIKVLLQTAMQLQVYLR